MLPEPDLAQALAQLAPRLIHGCYSRCVEYSGPQISDQAIS